MICSFITTIPIFLFVCSCSSSFSVPKVIYEGFTWGENLVFDGLGSLFATDYERGELWRLYACTEEEEGFCSELYLNDDENISIRMQGSLATTPTEDDWFDISGTTINRDNIDGSTLAFSANFTGNFVWVRAKISGMSAGAITKILYNN